MIYISLLNIYLISILYWVYYERCFRCKKLVKYSKNLNVENNFKAENYFKHCFAEEGFDLALTKDSITIILIIPFLRAR